MFVLAITSFSALAGVLIWLKIIVPVDRMHQLSDELNDPGYKINGPVEILPQQSPEAVPVAFSNDLRSLYEAASGSRLASEKSVRPSLDAVNKP